MSKVAMGLFAVSMLSGMALVAAVKHSALGRNNTGKYSHSNLGVYPICLAYMSVFFALGWHQYGIYRRANKGFDALGGACPSLTRPKRNPCFYSNHIFLILF